MAQRRCLLAAVLLLTLAAPAAADEVADVRAAIARAGLGWTAGPTSRTRLPRAERRDFAAIPADILGRFTVSREAPPQVTPYDLPPAIDWRSYHGYNFVTPIRDQGQCGSCWAFGTIADIEAILAFRHSTPNPTIDLSEQQLIECSGSTLGCASGGITWLLPSYFLQNTGVTSESCYPYTSGAAGAVGVCQPVLTMSAACQSAIVKVDGATEILSTTPGFPQWDPPDFTLSAAAMTEIKNYLVARPVGVSMRAYDDLSLYTGGVYEPIPNPTNGGMHVVLIVGYDDAGGYWIVKNSWGLNWGEGGFFRIRYNTSSIGMLGFVYLVDEAHKDPLFCDLPTALTLDVGDPTATQPLTIANCGGGVLSWQANVTPDWLGLDTAAGQPVVGGDEVAAGTTYSVRLTRTVQPGQVGTITLTGAGNGPKTVTVTTTGTLPQDDAGAPPQADAAPRDTAPPAADAAAAADGPPAADAAGADGAAPPTGGSGCGCRAQPGAAAGLLALLGLALALGLARHRRR